MTEVGGLPALDPTRFVVTTERPRRDTLHRIALRLTDRPLVGPGQRVEPGQPIIQRFRDERALETPTTAAVVGLRPGELLDRIEPVRSGRRGRRAEPEEVRARVIEHGRDGITRLAAGSDDVTVVSPVSGVVEGLVPGRLDLRSEGVTVVGQVAWGRPTAGRIVIAADGPAAEMRASTIDVSVAGAILVVGSRIDIEAVSRARAIGAAGIVSGGIAGRDTRQLAESEMRRAAALHAAAPFAFLALGGYGRVPIPRHLWDLLTAADGRPAGILAESRQLVVGGDPEPLLAAAARPPGTVRVVAGELRDEEGILVGLAGPRAWPGGVYAPGGFVEIVRGGRLERTCLPLPALERLG